jgi:type I restriction enzyme, S subunit
MINLPDHWAIRPLVDIASYSTGRTPSRSNSSFWEKTGISIPWVAISDMTQYGTIVSTSETINEKAFSEVFHRRIVTAGSLLMSFKLTIGRISRLGIDACHNEAIISITPTPDVDQDYLGFFLSQVDYSDHQDRQVKGNTLNQAKIDQIPVVLPPFKEQKQIAVVLNRSRFAIEKECQCLSATSELKRAAMRELFTRGLRGETQKETEIGLVPESWEVSKLGNIGRIGNGSTPKRTIADYWNNGTYPWLTSAKVYDREITSADQFVSQRALDECHLPRIRPGAVLIAITGQGKTLGHCAVLKIEATINQHIAYLATDASLVNPSFIRGYLETQYDYLRQIASGGGSTKGALTCGFLRDLQVPRPSLPEQREIVEILDAIDRKIELHKKKKALLEELFTSLLHKLMTGEIRVEELNLGALTK